MTRKSSKKPYPPNPRQGKGNSAGSRSNKLSSSNGSILLPLVKGKGDYDLFDLPQANELDKRVRKLESKAAGSLGKTLGSTLGGLVGLGDLGGSVGNAVEQWFGHGDYEIKSNSLVQSISKSSQIPSFANSHRGLRITEREYLGDVVSGSLSGTSSRFTNTVYAVNPGDPVTFPWLSTLASQFEQYEPHGIIFEFKSTSSEFNGTSQALGTIIMATDYDVSDAEYPDKITMSTSDYACSGKASNTLIHGLECDPAERPLKVLTVRQGIVPTGENAKFYDLAHFQIATQGMSTAGAVLGELWVSYDITFYKKQYEFTNPTAVYDCTTTIAVATPFGSSQALLSSSAGMYMTFDNQIARFPPNLRSGRYLVKYQLVGGSATFTPGLVAGTNCTVVYEDMSLGVFIVNSTFSVVLEITAPAASFTVIAGALALPLEAIVSVNRVPRDYIL